MGAGAIIRNFGSGSRSQFSGSSAPVPTPQHCFFFDFLCRESAAHPGDGAGTADQLRPVEQLTCPRPSQEGH